MARHLHSCQRSLYSSSPSFPIPSSHSSTHPVTHPDPQPQPHPTPTANKISIDKTSFTLDKGSSTIFTFSLNQPIFCEDQSQIAECAVVIEIDNQSPAHVAMDNCIVKWNYNEWSQKRYLRVSAVDNFVNEGSLSFKLVTQPAKSDSTYYKNFNAPDITITTRPKPAGSCRGTGDPHYTTFDGMYWHVYTAGRYVLYSNRNANNDLDFEIQVATYAYPARHCAFAAKEGNDIFVMSFCGGPRRHRRSCGTRECQRGGFPKVSISGSSYSVVFASGRRIQMNGINIYVHAPSRDYQAGVQGICGNFNGNRNDDSPCGGCKLHNLNSLFDGQKPNRDLFSWYPSSVIDPVIPSPHVEECEYVPPVFRPPILTHPDQEDITDLLKDVQPEDDEEPIVFDFSDGEEPEPFMTEAAAREACAVIDDSQVAAACREAVPNFSTVDFIEDCADDLVLTGDAENIANAILALESRCAAEAAAGDTSDWEKADDGMPIPPEELRDNLCPAAADPITGDLKVCNGRGTCKDVRCTCDAGWSGANCAVNQNEAPVVTSVVHAYCNIRGGSCGAPPKPGQDGRYINVLGSNIWNAGDNLKCKFGDASHDFNVVTDALYLGSGEVLCAVPTDILLQDLEPLTLPVALTVDGQTFGDTSATFTWYNGVCHVCSDDVDTASNCKPNPESCNIEETCYLGTQSNPDNVCLQCSPETSISEWTYNYDNHVECGPDFASTLQTSTHIGQIGVDDVIETVVAVNTKVEADPAYTVTYEIESGEDVFYMAAGNDKNTANLRTNTRLVAGQLPLGFDNSVQIKATDQAGNIAYTTIIVEIVETPEPPIFTEETYTYAVPEDAEVGTVIGQPEVKDPNADITYTWFSQVEGHIDDLLINTDTGVITVGNGLDFETLRQYQLIARARDSNGQFHTAQVIVNIGDVDEAPTAILLESDGVEENAEDAVIGTLSVEDADGGEVTYSVEGANANDFAIDGATLKVARVGGFNYEKTPTVSVTIKATDTSNAALSYTQTLEVTVIDVNEPPHSIGLSKTVFSEADSLTAVADVLVSDDDNEEDPTKQFVACSVTKDEGGFFEISDNKLVLIKKLDFETAPSPKVTITCADDGEPTGVSEPKEITITVQNANDAPQDVKFTGAASVPEDADTSLPLDTISATDFDADSGDITFVLVGDRFELVGTPSCSKAGDATTCTQAVKLAAGQTLDFETSSEEEIVVRSIDNRGIESVNTLALAVTDVNEAPTGVAWADGDNKIAEDAKAGDIVGQLLAVDQDREQDFTFELLQGDDAFELFVEGGDRRRSVQGAAATVRVKDPSLIDFETAATMTLVVRVTDSGALTVEATTEVAVQDEPVVVYLGAVGTTTATMSESAATGTVVGPLVMEGDDRRNAPFNLDYVVALSDDSFGHFGLDGNNLVIAKPLDFEDQASLLVQVSVTLTGAANQLPAETVTYHDFIITVTDIDEAPVFEHDAYTLEAKDDQPTGTTQTNVQPAAIKAIDTDAGSGAVTYELLGDSTALAAFDIVTTGAQSGRGAIRTKQSLTAAVIAPGTYSLTVRATSGGLSTEVPLTITVVDDCAGNTACLASESCVDALNDYQCCANGACITSLEAENRVQGSNGDDKTGGLVGGAIAGAIVGTIIFIALVVLVVVLVLRQRNNNANTLFYKADDASVYTANPTYRPPTDAPAYAAVSRNPHFVPGVSNPMYEWYRPDMTRQECTETLMSADDGSFVVRDSKATPGWHMLGVKTSGAVVHEKIKMNEDGMYELLPASNARQPRFPDVPALVAHYGEPRADVPYILTLNFSNPMYGMGNQSAGQYHYAPGTALPNDPAAPHVPLKERERDQVAALAATEGDIYGNTTEARVAMGSDA